METKNDAPARPEQPMDGPDTIIFGQARMSSEGIESARTHHHHTGRLVVISSEVFETGVVDIPGSRQISIHPDRIGELKHKVSSTVRLDGPLDVIPFRVLADLFRAGVRRTIPSSASSGPSTSLLAHLARRLLKAAIRKIDHALESREYRLKRPTAPSIPSVKRPQAAFKSENTIVVPVLRGVSRMMRGVAGLRDIEFEHISRKPFLPTNAFMSGRAMLFNSALAWGGAERQIVNTMAGLADRGVDVRLALEQLGNVPDSTFFAPELDRLGLRYASVSDWAFEHEPETQPDLRDGMDEISALPEPYSVTLSVYLAAIFAFRPTVVHAWQDQTSVLAGVAATLAGVPRIVLSTRNLAPVHFPYHQPHMRSAYRALSMHTRIRLLNNSAAGAADYERWLDVPEGTFSVLRNGLDLSRFSPDRRQPRHASLENIPDGVTVIGSVFRFCEEKDPYLWLDAARAIFNGHPDTHFIIAGTGPMLNEFVEKARACGMGERLHLPGAIQRPETFLPHLDVFLLTSRLEGLPNVLIEAQACGVPVISTSVGGASETFIPGKTGFLVDKRDARTIAETTLNALRRPDWLANARRPAALQARERFGLDRMIDETLAIYDMQS